ncbi:hypothetical protein LAZ67_3005640 [Cordylochernes scorpioides]|uniref:Mos1 transposase HTH domain-containing protein n=1 Tax=Cordylochernes scorpioides TaxID=51811 RepID=A0ABY6KAH4_9ARAC|nr:hypothetical protein LAZ67_3005640 [Cordylochernes scorpioides]
MWVSINGRHVEALIDTGASYSVDSSNFRKTMKAIMFESPNITLRVANNRFVAPLGKCRLRVEINGLQRIFEFLVLPNCSHDAILGWDFLESSKAVIDCGHSEISFSETLNEDQSAAQLHLASDDIIPPKCTKRVLTRTPSVTGIKNCAVEGAKNSIPVWVRTESGDICGERRTWRLASGRVDDPARWCQESLTSERPTSRLHVVQAMIIMVGRKRRLLLLCELRSVIRFLAAKKNSAKDIHTELCQVYGEGCMSSGMVRRWVRKFKNGRTDDHDEPRAGRPSVSDETIAKVEAAMLEDRSVTVRKL